MNLKEIERIVSLIQASIFKRANSHTTGMLKSHFRGSGLQFREHQVYVPGDDVRFIDWKVSAKSSHIYLKTFEEDRNVEINVFLDITETLSYGDNQTSKLQALVEIVALLYLLAGQTHDLVKVTIWKNESTSLPPKKGKEGLTLFISFLERLGVIDKDGNYQTDFSLINGMKEEEKVTQLKAALARKKEVVYLGDGHSFPSLHSIESFMSLRNFHFFNLLSPLDRENVSRYFIKGYKTSSWIGGNKSRVKDPRVKEIFVSERYLDRFVRELV